MTLDCEKYHDILSSNSLRTSLEAISSGTAGLNARRQSMLERVPNSNDWASFPRNSIKVKDIAYLSAATDHEFAILRGKTKDILFHGVMGHCYFDEELVELLKSKKLRLVAHTHPDYESITASADDRDFLITIGQKCSIIISYITGKEMTFFGSIFEEIGGGMND